MSTSWTLEPEAYALPLLHAAKHPSASVNGLFIGSSSSKTITKAIPLHHLPQSLQYSFAQELSFELVAKHVDSLGGGLEIVGYYQANERLDDDALGQRGEKVLAALKAGAGPEAAKSIFALVIQDSKLATSEPAYIPYTYAGANASTPSAAKFTDVVALTVHDIPARTLQLIRTSNVHQELRDCDDYLEDASIDFLQNEKVATVLKSRLGR